MEVRTADFFKAWNRAKCPRCRSWL